MAQLAQPLVRAVAGNAFFYCGAAEGSLAAARALGAASVLFLVPSSAAKAAEDAAAAAALGYTASASVGVDAPAGLTRAVADACVDALARLPAPALVACASGNRASAAIAIAAARSAALNGAGAIDWAIAHKLPFLTTQPLRNWVVASVDATPPPAAYVFDGVIFRQLFEPVSSTYTYILACAETREAVIIDAVLGKVDRDVTLLNELGLVLTHSLNTHVHADHISGSAALRAKVPTCRSGIAAGSGAVSDICLADGDVVRFGCQALRVLATPGHTAGCLSFVLEAGAVFTGDALLVRGCGRTDFQGGSAAMLYASLRRLFALPDATLVFPAHDYTGATSSTIGEEKRFNPRAGAARSADDFVAIMAALALPRPAQMDVAVPANLLDGDATGGMEAGAGRPSPCQRCSDVAAAGAIHVPDTAEAEAPAAGAAGGAAAIA